MTSTREGEVHTIALAGELDIGGAPRFESELQEAEAGGASSIVVDLRELQFIDSTGIRLLVMATERCGPERMTVRRGPAQVHRVFEITALVDRLPFSD